MKKITKISILFASTQFIILICLCFVELWFVVVTFIYALGAVPIISEMLDPVPSISKYVKKHNQKQNNA